MASLLPFVNSASLFSYQMYRVTFFNQFGSHIAIYSNVAVAVLVCVSMRQNTLRSICFSALINIAKNETKILCLMRSFLVYLFSVILADPHYVKIRSINFLRFCMQKNYYSVRNYNLALFHSLDIQRQEINFNKEGK